MDNIFEYDLNMRAMTRLKYLEDEHNPTDAEIAMRKLESTKQRRTMKLKKLNLEVGRLKKKMHRCKRKINKLKKIKGMAVESRRYSKKVKDACDK